jgi:hypothetical protein
VQGVLHLMWHGYAEGAGTVIVLRFSKKHTEECEQVTVKSRVHPPREQLEPAGVLCVGVACCSG